MVRCYLWVRHRRIRIDFENYWEQRFSNRNWNHCLRVGLGVGLMLGDLFTGRGIVYAMTFTAGLTVGMPLLTPVMDSLEASIAGVFVRNGSE